MNRFYRSIAIRKMLFAVAFGLSFAVQAQQFGQQQQQEEKELPPVSRTYAITNATVVQGPGRKIEQATVVIKDGLISAVGKNVSIPPEAILIKGDSLHVYAGFIDGLSRVGVAKPKEGQPERPKDPGNPTPEQAGITPERDVRTTISASEKSIEELRALGFTAAQVVPYGNMLPGNASIIMLSGKTTDAMVLVGKSALFSELTGAQRMYPTTVIAVMAKFRELYRQAVQAKNFETMYAANRTGLNRPATDRILEAFYPVIDKRMPVLFEADKFLETQRIMTLQSDLGFNLIMADVKEGWDAIPKIKSSGSKVFLSLDLPEDKKDEKKDGKDKKPAEPKKEEAVSTLTPAEKEALEKRKAEFLALYDGQANMFQKAGVQFGFSTLSTKSADIKANMKRMIKAGLTEDQALAGLTTNPAALLGLSDRLGSVDNGKIANLVVSDKPYFNDKAKVRYVFVDGTMYKYDPKETPKADPPTVEIVGTWATATATPQGKSEEVVSFKKEGSIYTGSITSAKIAQAIALEKVELNGSSLKYSYTVQMEGQTFKVDVDAKVEADAFKGNATVGSYGSFTIEGKKDPNN
jgi:imidazolonepropionase-like amidohydrolase